MVTEPETMSAAAAVATMAPTTVSAGTPSLSPAMMQGIHTKFRAYAEMS